MQIQQQQPQIQVQPQQQQQQPQQQSLLTRPTMIVTSATPTVVPVNSVANNVAMPTPPQPVATPMATAASPSNPLSALIAGAGGAGAKYAVTPQVVQQGKYCQMNKYLSNLYFVLS